MIIPTKQWNTIAKFYSSPDWDMLPMLKLVEEIAASSYAQGIYGATSMYTLLISQHQDFELDQNTLRVDFIKDNFTFTYRESPFSLENWQKECGQDEGFSTFEHVMRRLKWFLELDECT
jgi:hypothetical protein